MDCNNNKHNFDKSSKSRRLTLDANFNEKKCECSNKVPARFLLIFDWWNLFVDCINWLHFLLSIENEE